MTNIDSDVPQFSSRYVLEKQLGVGGMGAVYKGYDNVLATAIAVKLLPRGINKEAAMRFQLEAKAAGKLDHPNILRVRDFGESDRGELYLIMDYIEGQNLADLIERSGPLPVERALPLFVQICSGLEHAHANDVLHRDIKPSNIMLLPGEDGDLVKIVDFGIAKLVSEDQKLTTTGNQIGSPLFMSPEQARGERADRRSDIYSLGALMFTVLTGEPPFTGESVIEVMKQHAECVAPRLNDGYDQLQFPEELEEFVDKALKKDRSERYQSVSDLKQDLLAMQQKDVPESIAPEERKETGLPRRRLLVALAVLAIGLFAFFTVIIIGFREEKPQLNAPDEAFYEQDMFGFKWLIAQGDIHRNKIKKLISHNNIRLLKIIDPKLDDSDLNDLADLSIEALDVSGTAITDDGLKALAKIPGLKVLDLSDTGITNGGARLLGELKDLDYVVISGTKIDGRGLATLAKTNLRGIDISRMKGVNGNTLEHVAEMPRLTMLRMCDEDNIQGSDLSCLAKCKHLKYLSVANLRLTDADLAPIERLELYSIDISNNQITDRGLEELHPYLFGVLDVRGCPQISKQEIDSIQKKRSIEFLGEPVDVPKIQSDYTSEKDRWEPIQLRDGVIVDQESYLGRVPLDFLDPDSDRVLRFLMYRTEVEEQVRNPNRSSGKSGGAKKKKFIETLIEYN